jgi:hypothetical protein
MMLKFVQRFIQFTNMGLLPIDYKTLWLLYVHFFFNYTIQEGSLEIHLEFNTDFPYGLGTTSHTSFLMMDWYSSIIIVGPEI